MWYGRHVIWRSCDLLTSCDMDVMLIINIRKWIQITYVKVSAYLRDPTAVLFHLPSFLLEAIRTANPSRVPKYALVFSEVSVAQSLVFGVVICWWLLVLVITNIGVNEHERLFNITQRFYCCSIELSYSDLWPQTWWCRHCRVFKTNYPYQVLWFSDTYLTLEWARFTVSSSTTHL
jgi:hypothetical protein